MKTEQVKKELIKIYLDWQSGKLKTSELNDKDYSEISVMRDAGHKLYNIELQYTKKINNEK